MKNNKKGFTLIELLAVIVILAIIMVIAVPQILNVIENSRKSAWDSNVKLVKEGIDLGTTLSGTGFVSSSEKFTLSTACACTGDNCFTTEVQKVADISAADTKVECTTTVTSACTGKTYEITVTPATGGSFANVPAGSNQPAKLCY